MTGSHFINVTKHECYFELLKTFRTPEFVIPALIFPGMCYLFFGILFNPASDASVPAYLMATYGVFGIMGPALFSFGANVAVERQRNMLVLKQISPLPAISYFISKLVVSLVFAAIIVASLFIIGALLGNVKMSLAQWLTTFVVMLLGVPVFSMFGLVFGLLLSGNAAVGIINIVYFPLAFMSGLMIPLSFFPNLIQIIGSQLPPYHLVQLVLKVQALDQQTSILWHMVNLVAFTVLCSVIAIYAYRTKLSR